MDLKLTARQRRVLGSLMEKAMAQPDYYPMTLSALTAACNQKSNRDPVMELTEPEVDAVIEELCKRGLAVVVVPPPGARTQRYRHDAETVFGWSARQKAVMTELLIRGPQTVGELRTRCTRLFQFEDLQAITTVIDSLAHADPPMVAVMPRMPGQSAVRYAHLLYTEGEQPAEEAAGAAPTSAPQAAAVDAPEVGLLRSEVAELTGQLSSMRAALDDVNRRLSAIESQLL